MTKITTPGIYNISLADYHNDPCEEVSISSSGLRTIDAGCPKLFWVNSPLNPHREHFTTPAFEFGRATHDWLLQKETFWDHNHVLGEGVKLTTKAGRAERDAALAEGKTVIKHEEFQSVQAMRQAVLEHEFAGAAFENGQAEPTLAWKDEETGVWLRCRPDWLPAVQDWIPDYKTAVSAKPAEFQRAVWNHGYHMQAALYLEGIEAVTGKAPRNFFFVVQEKKAPFIVTVIALDRIAIEWGQQQNRRAIRVFADCLERDTWPGYSSRVEQIGLPGFAEYQLQQRHEAGEFDTFAEDTAA
ncbi:PD-(D/E)XK nuclease-like domain-containing protein [Pelagibius sp.]|uniref:PD-(D/E)XK nuclease-like domain-containing protein n=1 Tax=Pelagibius sp. TaxID=1931238 RepID=UPI003BAEC288